MTTASDPAKKTSQEYPGAGGSGMIETVKRAVMIALREALTGTTLSRLVNGTDVSVDMEYPIEKANYPGIWVQFSFSEIVQAGIGHEPLIRTVLTGTEDNPEDVRWDTVREIQFKGRVTLTILALSSLERDRIADSVITMLAFSRPPDRALTKPSEDTKQFRQLIASLAANPFVCITLNHDQIIPGGQAMTTGVPWDEEIPGYEDTYSFDILGQTNILFSHDGTYTLRAIAQVPQLVGEISNRDYLWWCANSGLDPTGSGVYQMWLEAGTPTNDIGWL
jgi:hypothetical protein